MIERRKKPAAMATATKRGAGEREPAATLANAHSMPVAAR